MPRCVICLKKNKQLSSFNTLNKCKSVMEIRKTNNLAFSNVILPDTVIENENFHRICYQKFIALPKKHRPSISTSNVEASTWNEPSPGENSELPIGTETESARQDESTSEFERLDENDNASARPEESYTESAELQESHCDDLLLDDNSLDILTPETDNLSQDYICIICEQSRKRFKRRNQVLSSCQTETIKNLKESAEVHGNIDLLKSLVACQDQKTSVYCHPYCKRDFLNKVNATKNELKEKKEWHVRRSAHKSSFEIVAQYVGENVVRLGNCYFLIFFKDMYTEHIRKEIPDYECTVEGRYLEERLLSLFPRKIAIVSLEKKKVVKPFSGVLLKNNLDVIQKEDVLNRAAMILRSEVLKIKKRPLPENITSIDLISNLKNCKIRKTVYVTVRCSDTDVLIIILGNIHVMRNDLKLKIQTGTRNNQRLVDINRLYEILGKKLCRALPAFHGLTGCDFNPAFYRKGKPKPLKILRQSPKYMEALIKLSSLSEIDLLEKTFEDVEEYVCRIYGHRQINDINLCRLGTFMEAYKFSDKDELLKLDQNFEGSMLPPCKSELRQHILRTSYIAQLWSNAHCSIPTTSSPTDFGWELQDNKYIFTWFEGDQLPRLADISIDQEKMKESLEKNDENDIEDVEESPIIDDESGSSSEEDKETDSKDSDCEDY